MVMLFIQTLDSDLGKCLKLLLEIGANQTFKYEGIQTSALHLYLVNSKCDPHFKCTHATMEMCNYLVSMGADVNQPQGLLAYAINYCCIDVCKFLLENGAKVSSFLSYFKK